jgi:hypothetical protein
VAVNTYWLHWLQRHYGNRSQRYARETPATRGSAE